MGTRNNHWSKVRQLIHVLQTTPTVWLAGVSRWRTLRPIMNHLLSHCVLIFPVVITLAQSTVGKSFCSVQAIKCILSTCLTSWTLSTKLHAQSTSMLDGRCGLCRRPSNCSHFQRSMASHKSVYVCRSLQRHCGDKLIRVNEQWRLLNNVTKIET